MKKYYFEVWAACKTLATYDTLEEAVRSAGADIKDAVNDGLDLAEAEEDDESPRIHQHVLVEHELSTRHDVEKVYSIQGDLIYTILQKKDNTMIW